MKLSRFLPLIVAANAWSATPCNEAFGDAFMDQLLTSVAKHDPKLMRSVFDKVVFIPAFHGEPHIDTADKVEEYYTKLFNAKPNLLVTGATKAEFSHDETGVWMRDGQYLVTWTNKETGKPDQSLLRYTLVYAPNPQGQCKVVMLRASCVCDTHSNETPDPTHRAI